MVCRIDWNWSGMNFTFLHAADLHLGSPLTGLAVKDAEVARRIGLASRAAFTALVDRAIEEAVAFVIIAGDVYDGEWRDTSIGLFFNREVARLDRNRIPVFLVKGNHDAESVVTRTISLPDSVRAFSTRRAETFRIEDLRVALHGRSFPDRSVAENFALQYPDPVPGWLNVGILHTSLDGRPGHATYAPCSLADLSRLGYDYWALGHVHEHEVVARDPWVVYPGNIQGRSVRECGPKGAVLVDVRDGAISDLRRIDTAAAEWAVVATDLDGIEDEAAALKAVEAALTPVAAAAADRLLALRIRLTGSTPLHRRLAADPVRFRDEVQAAADRVHDDAWIESVRIETLEPPVALDPALSAIDIGALTAGLETDPDLRRRILAEIGLVVAKLPPDGDAPPLPDEIDAILADARALVLGRAAAGEG
jgi:exonuclease SbcD